MGLSTTEECVAEEERLLGRSLPDALRARLRDENGGEVECEGETWQLHPVFDPRDRRTIQRSANHIFRETRAAETWAGFPAGAIVIASDGSGNLLVLLRGDDDVHRWDHETRECQRVTVDW